MLKVADIKAPISDEMQRFEAHFKDAMKSNTPLLDKITHYIIKRKGKQMRPMFVFLTAKMCGEINEASYTAASMIELLHTATLVHDDVVDDAYKRRGFFSVNALWKNKIAVLVGDYLLSRGLLMSVDQNAFELLRIITNAVREMSEGELLQIEKARKLNITEEVYFEIIRRKTASLIAACCESGAAAVQDDKEVQESMRLFGEKVGIAFQIKDDLFDYGSDDNIGKPTGIDIKERKMTLPLIYALNQSTKSEKRRIIKIIKNHNENPEKVKEVIDYVIKSDGLTYSHKIMLNYTDEALAILDGFPDSPSKESLKQLVDYTIHRKK
ncbi:MAG: polyprenyl synthetase family protein [Flavobacteriales bacterium]|nr:polyprenyl synthetase family protein [Flavobacteriales bacterium]MDG1779802.1 polyprenyl synthetase family protein [Flavobacteriales bacterium]MDG2246838.1 polyprenyl synthetase family protein [Flavobacteriales bacterium]